MSIKKLTSAATKLVNGKVQVKPGKIKPPMKTVAERVKVAKDAVIDDMPQTHNTAKIIKPSKTITKPTEKVKATKPATITKTAEKPVVQKPVKERKPSALAAIRDMIRSQSMTDKEILDKIKVDFNGAVTHHPGHIRNGMIAAGETELQKFVRNDAGDIVPYVQGAISHKRATVLSKRVSLKKLDEFLPRE